MKFLVKVWVWRPLFSEVVIDAANDEEALKKIKNFKEDEIEWQSNPLKGDRVTYEVYTKSDKDAGK
jgi:hypothetical protein|tara:strand:+ start:356 stop:553 length:198 start_codon:yes stop_codon:yes gene_type:complete